MHVLSVLLFRNDVAVTLQMVHVAETADPSVALRVTPGLEAVPFSALYPF